MWYLEATYYNRNLEGRLHLGPFETKQEVMDYITTVDWETLFKEMFPGFIPGFHDMEMGPVFI